MFILSTLAVAVAPAFSCGFPGQPAPERLDLLAGAPVGPDGRAHLLTGDDATICWWSVSEDGDAEVHRVWPLPGPHGVGLVVLEDGAVLIALRSGGSWGVLRVEPDGEERAWPVVGAGQLVGLRADGRRLELEWQVGHERRATTLDLETGAPAGAATGGRPDAPQSRR